MPDADVVVSPAGQTVDVGVNRIAFGVFSLDGEQVEDADIALYFAEGQHATARGPLPARVESLKTPAAFRAMTTAEDPGAATSVYVVPQIEVREEGELTMYAAIRRDGKFAGSRTASVVVGKFDKVPGIGDSAPRFHTPTVDDVSDITEIETRIPPDSMHGVDYADVLGVQPILLVIATPQFCQTRVCGPSVDIAEEVKSRIGDGASFIHMEVFNENDPSRGVRPQLRALKLETEPWAFVVDRNGRISARFEGAFGSDELTRAMQVVVEPG